MFSFFFDSLIPHESREFCGMKKFIFLFAGLLASLTLFAQETEKTSSNQQTVGVAIGNGNDLTVIRGTYLYYFGLGKTGKIKFGVGLNAFYGFGEDHRYALVNTSNVGDGDENEDAIRLADVGLGGLNSTIAIKYTIKEKWDIGIRWDVLGFGFGAGQGGVFEDVSEGTSLAVKTKSPNPNINFTRGQVMSDNIWVGYTLGGAHQIYASFSFLGSEYELDGDDQNLDDPRFERIHNMVFLGYNYKF